MYNKNQLIEELGGFFRLTKLKDHFKDKKCITQT